jgi:hypothetical protein
MQMPRSYKVNIFGFYQLLIICFFPSDGFYQSLIHGFATAQNVPEISSSAGVMFQPPNPQSSAETPSHSNPPGL